MVKRVKRIAIIGAGPAGVSAAKYVNDSQGATIEKFTNVMGEIGISLQKAALTQ